MPMLTASRPTAPFGQRLLPRAQAWSGMLQQAAEEMVLCCRGASALGSGAAGADAALAGQPDAHPGNAAGLGAEPGGLVQVSSKDPASPGHPSGEWTPVPSADLCSCNPHQGSDAMSSLLLPEFCLRGWSIACPSGFENQREMALCLSSLETATSAMGPRLLHATTELQVADCLAYRMCRPPCKSCAASSCSAWRCPPACGPTTHVC